MRGKLPRPVCSGVVDAMRFPLLMLCLLPGLALAQKVDKPADTPQPPAAAAPPVAGPPQACPADATGLAAGAALACVCPQTGGAGQAVWGSGPYTSDSSICTAALHAGAVSRRGGTVTLRMLPGQQRYVGSTRNGVQSINYGAYHASFQFDGVQTATGPQPCPDDMTAYAGSDEKLTCTCPAVSNPRGSVWGTDTYTADSAVCAAALHAGAVSRRGGEVTLRMLPGRPRYPGTTRNGVQSIDYPDYGASYAFQNVSAGPQICPDTMLSYANTDETLTCVCSGEAVARGTAIWGSGPYTGDSHVCRAARHAGVVPVTGGSVTVRMLPGQPRYAASTRNGVTSTAYGDYGSSYRFDGAQNVAAAAPVQAPVADSLRRTGRVSLYVTFRTNSADLDIGAAPVLQQVRDAMQEDPSLRLRLIGHTDNQGGPSVNVPLSQRRAQSVRDWLVQNGIGADRLLAEGRGQNEPIADNASEPGRALNRRVEAVRVE
ncbi:LCCL domain-containing protein [Falsiroseomonas sp. HW251]|uniref:LCCL domain-containing protein n=1 Tax=Falsiroseomonas sp. HW251 TaxID=3390998 RepID=UPI003D3185AC